MWAQQNGQQRNLVLSSTDNVSPALRWPHLNKADTIRRWIVKYGKGVLGRIQRKFVWMEFDKTTRECIKLTGSGRGWLKWKVETEEVKYRHAPLTIDYCTKSHNIQSWSRYFGVLSCWNFYSRNEIWHLIACMLCRKLDNITRFLVQDKNPGKSYNKKGNLTIFLWIKLSACLWRTDWSMCRGQEDCKCYGMCSVVALL